MLLRFAAALSLLAIGFAGPTEHAAAQGYPYVRGGNGLPPGAVVVPGPDEDDSEESIVMVPEPRRGLPYPPQQDRYVPQAPGFIYPDRGEPQPPYGHMPSRSSTITRGELPPVGAPGGDGYAPRPPGGIDPNQQTSPGQQTYPGQQQPAIATLPPEDQPEVGEPKQLPPQFRRQLVDYRTKEPAGTIIIDTANTYLYLVMGNGQAMRYGIGVGREGFTWSGTERVSRMAEWPDWHPPEEMIERQPYLPRFMAGGEGNPLGARALYLGKTLYRIHGTNQPSTIGTFVSSGCVRLTNADIQDLYERVKTGTRVVVLPGRPPATADAQPSTPFQGLAPAPGSAAAARAQGPQTR